MEQIVSGGTLDVTSLAVPIAYECKYVADNSVANVNMFSTYTKRSCKTILSDYQRVVIKLESLTCEQQNDEAGSSSEFGYHFWVDDNQKFIIDSHRGFAKEQRTAAYYYSMENNTTKEISAVQGEYRMKITDFNSATLNFHAQVVEIDDASADDESPQQNLTLKIKDLVTPGSPVPKSNKFRVEYEGNILVFEFTVSLEDEN